VFLAEQLTLWTALGNLSLGVLAGLVIGLIAREVTRRSRPGSIDLPDGGICPVCKTRSLRRQRYALPQRLRATFTNTWPYRCRTCGWVSTAPAPAVRERRPLAKATSDVHTPPLALDGNAVVAPTAERAFLDDAAEIKEVVLRHLAMLKSGDLETRAKYCLSESTSFGLDGGRLISLGFDRHMGPLDTEQVFDLRCRDLKIYTHQDTAIATAYLVGTATRPDGASIPVAGRSSWALVRQDRAWKIAHMHLSPLIRSR
jgi:ketosteroid isomerase-like protein/rubredoxin